MGRANAFGNAVVTPGYDPSVMAATTSACVGGVTIDCVAPATVGTTDAVGSPFHPTVTFRVV